MSAANPRPRLPHSRQGGASAANSPLRLPHSRQDEVSAAILRTDPPRPRQDVVNAAIPRTGTPSCRLRGVNAANSRPFPPRSRRAGASASSSPRDCPRSPVGAADFRPHPRVDAARFQPSRPRSRRAGAGSRPDRPRGAGGANSLLGLRYCRSHRDAATLRRVSRRCRRGGGTAAGPRPVSRDPPADGAPAPRWGQVRCRRRIPLWERGFRLRRRTVPGPRRAGPGGPGRRPSRRVVRRVVHRACTTRWPSPFRRRAAVYAAAATDSPDPRPGRRSAGVHRDTGPAARRTHSP